MDFLSLLSTLGVIILFGIAVISSAIKVVQEYERGVIFRLGRVLSPARGPGGARDPSRSPPSPCPARGPCPRLRSRAPSATGTTRARRLVPGS